MSQAAADGDRSLDEREADLDRGEAALAAREAAFEDRREAVDDIVAAADQRDADADDRDAVADAEASDQDWYEFMGKKSGSGGHLHERRNAAVDREHARDDRAAAHDDRVALSEGTEREPPSMGRSAAFRAHSDPEPTPFAAPEDPAGGR